MKSFAILALLFLAPAARQDEPEPVSPQAQHEWLQQLVGEWTVKTEASSGPGTEPMVMESTESVRSIGGLWVMAEQKASLMGTPFTSILTLGYDPQKGKFVGTWIDSMQTHMWSYTGTLDESRKVLTLDTEGPSFDNTTKMARYRDVIEVKSPDLKTMTSAMQGEDGTWTTFLNAEYRRQPAKRGM